MSYMGCSVSTTPPGTVRVPYSTRLVQTNWSQLAQCGAGTAGWDRQNTEIIQDQFNQDFTFDNQTITETITIARNDFGLTCDPTRGSQCNGADTTRNGGTFNDHFWFCSASCTAPFNGETDVTQVIYYNGIPVHNTNLVVYKCGSITWNLQ